MQPVRITFPGYMASFPLKMVTVGARGIIGLSLWVIAEQRYGPQNYPTRKINERDLSWDWAANRSNYLELFDDSISTAGGRAWVVEYASRLSDLVFSSSEVAFATQGEPYPYLTRLRTRMLTDHLTRDLTLGPARDSTDVSANLIAENEINRPVGNCEQGEIRRHGCAAGAGAARFASTVVPTLLVLLGLALRGRRRRRKRSR